MPAKESVEVVSWLPGLQAVEVVKLEEGDRKPSLWLLPRGRIDARGEELERMALGTCAMTEDGANRVQAVRMEDGERLLIGGRFRAWQAVVPEVEGEAAFVEAPPSKEFARPLLNAVERQVLVRPYNARVAARAEQHAFDAAIDGG